MIRAYPVHFKKCGPGQIRAMDVARAYVWAGDDDLSSLARSGRNAIVHDVNLSTRFGATHRERIIFCKGLRPDPDRGRCNRGFRGPISVPELCLWESLQQSARDFGREGLTTEPEFSYIRHHGLRK